ncbi:hypothetical protein ADT27_00785 [Xanthomonas oryzae]|uniref:hypothetical protein n=1 Tax=Xanthomonas oryzae TaxID=347 RepID=UPI0006ABF1FD|nr:hypothetical protein [Xanthomonas oryzae]KOR54417.1 hypothetical protein ADT27_00785 [Xanthomonas oryzae]
MSKHTTLKLQLTSNRVVDLITTWDVDLLKYRISCADLPGFLAYTEYLADAKKAVLQAVWVVQGSC